MCRKLRPHHGLCIQFFEGKGYSEAFTVHMEEVIAQLMQNPEICLLPEEDDVCQKCPNRGAQGCRTKEKVLSYDKRVLKLCGIKSKDEMKFLDFLHVVQKEIIEKNKMSQVCADCGWAQICHNKKSLFWSSE